MKSLLILVLTVALLAAAFFTRPTEDDFHRFFKAQAADRTTGNWIERTFGGLSTDSYLDHCTYQNKYLWANIVHDDQIIFTGAFAHWIERNAKLDPSSTHVAAPGVASDEHKSALPTYEFKHGK